MRRRRRRRQINVRLMLLSTHSAAELRILDSGAGLGSDEEDFRRDFPCTSPVSHPLADLASPPSLPPSPPTLSSFRYEDVRASSLQRLPGEIFSPKSLSMCPADREIYSLCYRLTANICLPLSLSNSHDDEKRAL